MNNSKMRKRWLAAGMSIALIVTLTGCASKAPKTLTGTSWKITELTAPDGTKYDEQSYDTIIGSTIYTFDESEMTSTVTNVEQEAATAVYQYTYEDGTVTVTSTDVNCTGTVKGKQMTLQLGTQGSAVLTKQ